MLSHKFGHLRVHKGGALRLGKQGSWQHIWQARDG
jgi:hypothetical protein